jgi:hypothetical protein
MQDETHGLELQMLSKSSPAFFTTIHHEPLPMGGV